LRLVLKEPETVPGSESVETLSESKPE